MNDGERDSANSTWKYRVFMLGFWIVLIGMFSFLFLDFFPTSLPIWGDWRFFLSK